MEVLIFLIQTYQQFQSLIQKKMVFEVKYTEYLPKIVQSVLPGKADMMAVSKYVLAYEKSQYLNGFEYWEDGNI